MNNMDKNRSKLLQTLIEMIDEIMKSRHSITTFPFDDFQLSRPQFMILFFIAPKKSGATVKELAKFMRVTPGAVTQFVDILVKKKLVSREEGSNDRRISSIKLSAAAKKQFRRFKKEYFSSIGDAFVNLSTAEITQFISLVKKITVPNKLK